MRNITESFNLTNNFWDFNPQFLAIPLFEKLHKSDKSRGKKTSSNIMWAITLCNHPESDIYYYSDKENKVYKMVKDKSFKLEDYVEHIEAFKDMCLTQAQKSLVAWEDRLRDRDSFLADQEYHFGYVDKDGVEYKSNVKELDEMAGRTAKLYQEFAKIGKEIAEEKLEDKRGKGNKIKSATDAGEI